MKMKRALQMSAVAAAMSFALPASAILWDSDNSTGTTSERTITVNSNGTNYTLKARAYSSRAISSGTDGTAAGNPPAGSWVTAGLQNYSGAGFGITNNVAGDDSEATSPEHAIDNDQVLDIIVFELPIGLNWDLTEFRLGWASEDGVAKSDVQAWFGGSATSSIDFTKVCFTGCTNAADKRLVEDLGFKDITASINGTNGTGGSGEDIGQGNTNTFSGTQTGRYLVMTGQLGEGNDNFKINKLGATGTTPPGGHAPEPASLALLGVGLFGLMSMRRRRLSA